MKLSKIIRQGSWMIGIWIISVLALAAASLTFRLLMTAAGFKS
ncbi:DUF2474 domain-containing protein [Vibrio cincinnatiensis]|nr:DUF2474 domain-containing protein [Vibrio cincinnatiensis]